ncbi:MAG: YfhO family protein [Rhodothermaceae bacterium]|nr:YfhO family protein [Rhodothermaceae bacterium]
MARLKATRYPQGPRSWWAMQPPLFQHTVCAVVLLIVAMYFCWPTLFSGKSLVGGDIVQWRAAAQSMFEYRQETGEEPLWAANLFAGMPGYNVSPPALVPQIDEIPRAIRRISWPFSHVIFMLMGTYIFVWYLLRDTLSSLLAACVYGMPTYLPVILVAGHNTKFVALAFAPWLLLAFIHGMRKPSLMAGLLFAVALAANLRAGHVQITYYVTFIALVWWIVLAIEAWRQKKLPPFLKSTGLLAMGSVLALLMVAEYYWPTIEYKEYSIRGMSSGGEAGGLTWDYAMRWSQSPGELLTLLVADAYGGGAYYWGSKPFTGGPHYAGSIALLLGILAVWRIRSRLAISLGIAGGLMILFSLGHHFGVLNRAMFNYFPLYDAFRVPETWLIAVVLVLAVLSALGLSYIVRREVSVAAERTKWNAIYIIFGVTGGVLMLLLATGGSLFDFQREGERQQVITYVAQSAQRSPTDPQVVAAAEQLLSEQLVGPRKDAFMADLRRSLLFVVLTSIALVAVRRGKLSSWVFQGLLVLLVVLDLGGVGRRYLDTEQLSVSKNPAQSITTLDVDEYVLEQEGQFRVLSLESLDQTGLGRPSFHHESLGGYSAVKLRLYQDFLDNILMDPNTSTPNENALDMMNVRYILSQAPVSGTSSAYYGSESGFSVYENLDVLPRAYLVGQTEIIEDPSETMYRIQELDFDPAVTAILPAPIEEAVTPIDSSSTVIVNTLNHGPRRITYEVETDAPRLLVISEVYYPAGWTATLNGESVPIHRANYLLRAVAIPAGIHTLEMSFDPASQIWGKRISMISTIFVYGLTLIFLGFGGYGYFRRTRG